MRLSTGIILSILSANVFAIEHPNGAHPRSLLARRAVVADADSPSLQKRNNDKEPEEQANPKVSSIPDFGKEKFAYINFAFEDCPDLDPKTINDIKEGTTNSPVHDPNQDNGDEGERKNVHTGIDSDQGRSSFVDTPEDSSSQALGHIETEPFHGNPGVGSAFSELRLLLAPERVYHELGGEKGSEIEQDVREMFSYALGTSKNYKGLYNDLVKSPFSLKLPSSASDELKKEYKSLQDGVQQSIKNHILDIEMTINNIFMTPEHVSFWLKEMMEKTDAFYEFIFNTKSEYSRLLTELKISDDMYLEDLETHIKAVEEYKWGISGRFKNIEKMIKDNKENSKQRDSSKLLSSIMRYRGRLGIKTKSSKSKVLLKDVELENNE
ncbi:hypothetical protein BASA82_001063 [Batrachochytrium salamandrivorans]|uniref:Plasmodium RESA N-terminal domain-containing protein n=1 Tax=Batrachochytrium salamandrivorans TaxID=1357716 RepID=A0ABQ8EX69_9FUNG|nr:hypothetical protein BASA61_009125 [Batrachochytrium salamandrivorans]KAH6588032.1 hypothetical protein BASA50_010895 [Batrachochytrium salamandrivorans]KAH9257134.1 hypothetical protein BASA81_004684 [Batrachochytrium salamandrivorans]KAH9261303.1 hypothetical protein BASA82_001063 [Batrachochytrium salamandrivorans]